MIRRAVIAAAVALSAATFATPPAQAMTCSPVAADVCATVGFVCGRLAYHRIAECNFD